MIGIILANIGLVALIVIGILIYFTQDTEQGQSFVRRISFWFVAAASLINIILSLSVLISGSPLFFNISTVFIKPLLFEIGFKLDTLSASFLLLISIVSVAVTGFAARYMERFLGELKHFYPPYLFLIASVMWCLIVENLFLFFILLQIIIISSYLLLCYNKSREEKLVSEYHYLVSKQLGLILLLIAMLPLVWHIIPLSGAGFSGTCESLSLLSDSSPVPAWIIYLVLAVGALIFLQMWPLRGKGLVESLVSHPMPGILALQIFPPLIGFYILMRLVSFGFQPGSSHYIFGFMAAALGAISCTRGVVTALGKRDLLISSGYILHSYYGFILFMLGVGCVVSVSRSLLFLLLFLCAGMLLFITILSYTMLGVSLGSVQFFIGHLEPSRLGNLRRYLPMTSFCLFYAAITLCGLPPLAGFLPMSLFISGSFEAGAYYPIFGLIGIVIFIFSISIAIYLVKELSLSVFGEAQSSVRKARPKEAEQAKAMLWTQWSLLGVNTVLALFPGLLAMWGFRAILGMIQDRNIPMPFDHLFFGRPFLAVLVKRPTLMGEDVLIGTWIPLAVISILTVITLLTLFLARRFHKSSIEEDLSQNDATFAEISEEIISQSPHPIPMPAGALNKLAYQQKAGGFSIRMPSFFTRLADIDSWLYGPILNRFLRISELLKKFEPGRMESQLSWLLALCLLLAAIILMVNWNIFGFTKW